jgi:hypothetical protein
MKIRDTFDSTKDINRRIEKVISYAADDPQRLQDEVSEYVVTERIEGHFEALLGKMQDAMEDGGVNEVGVWVSGFYGSGKSSFTKYLAYALDASREIDGQPFLKNLSDQFINLGTRQLLKKLATNFPAAVITIDLGADQIAGATMEEISTVLYHKVLAYVGYSSTEKKVAQFELLLDQEGKYDDFKAEVLKRKGKEWSKIQNRPMTAIPVVTQLAPVFFPDYFPDEDAFRNLKIDESTTESNRVEQMLEILRKKTGKEYVIFVIDEVGQYVASRQNLILNLDGLARNLKEKGLSKAWIMATAQQTLTEDNPRAQLNAPELYRLNARFPIQIDLEADDIKEICYRRLLGKSEAGITQLGELFDSHGQQLRLSTKLKGTSYYQSDLAKDNFTNLYPFLPHHFQILLELLGRLAKSSGGIGLRSAIKIIQDVLIDPNALRAGQQPLADREIGTLASTVTIYDGLRREIERSFSNVVSAVSKAEESFGKESQETAVAKSIAILQILNNLPATQHNIAALMHPTVATDSLFDVVGVALKNIEKEKAIPLSCKDEQYRFLSDAILTIEQEKRALPIRDSDRKNAMNNRIRELFLPKPTARIEGDRSVASGLKALYGSQMQSLEGDREAVHFVISMIDASDYDRQINQLLNDSCERSNNKHIYLVAKQPQKLDEELIKAKQCDEIFKKHRHSIEADIRDYAEGQSQQSTRILDDILRELKKSFQNGSFIFRGQRTPVGERAQDFKDACNKELSGAASVIFEKYMQAPVQVHGEVPEKFLRANPNHLSNSIDPLSLVSSVGGQPKVREDFAALASIREYLETRGEQLGKSILDHFSDPPYGWAKDTTRYLIAAMLLNGEIKLRVSGEETTVVADVAIGALKTNQIFSRVGVGLRETRPDPERLMRAAERITDLTGEPVMFTEKAISEAVMKYFPDLQTRYTSLGGDLRELGLSGSERLSNTATTIAGLIKGDGSSAPQELGAETCELVTDLEWAAEVSAALKGGLSTTLKELKAVEVSIENLPSSGVSGEVKEAASDLLTQVKELLDQGDFYKQLSRFQELKSALDQVIAEGAEKFKASHAKIKEDELQSLQNSSTWLNLDSSTRERINRDIEAIEIETKADLAGLKQRVSHEYELNTRLREIREEAEKLAKKKADEKKESKVHMPVPRRFDTAEQIDELVERLQNIKDKLPADIDWKF